MSDLLNSASLVMIPSGYKEDVVYSQIPTDGSGDLSFTRASNGTRVNSAGLVEVTPWNLLEQSNAFSTSPWSKSAGATLTSGQTDPNGGTTAFRLQMSSASNYLASGIFTVASGAIYTYTIYIKSNTGSNQSFRLLDGVRGASGGILNGTATTSWQRFELQITTNSTSGAFQLDNAGGSYSNDLLICFAQANIGSTAKPYFPTTDRLNVPRLTYQNGGGGCPSLLLEKQSTNELSYSEDFSQTFWTKQGGTGTANATTSPDGTNNGYLFTNNSLNGEHNIYSNAITTTANQPYTLSYFVKKGTARYACVWIYYTGVNGGAYATFDLNTATLVSSGVSNVGTYNSSSIEDFGNGWYRISVTGTSIFSSIIGALDIRQAGSLVPNSFYTATGETMYFYGAQLEASSYATSLIPTTSSSATRVADACYKTGISSLIGQTSGTMFVDFEITNAGGNQAMIITSAAGNEVNRLQIYFNSSLQVGAYRGDASVNFVSSAYSVGQRIKAAVRYKLNDYAFYINGVQIGTDTSASIPPTPSVVYLGTYVDQVISNSIKINQSAIFAELTNAELASLTTI